MTQKGIPSNNKSIIIDKFKRNYPYHKDDDNCIYFEISKGTTARVDSFGDNALVISYWNDNNIDLCEDGDVRYYEDYPTLDDLFADMLKETIQ